MSNSADATRSTSLEWVLAVLLAVNLFWTTLCLGGYRPESMVWSILLTGVTLIVQLLGSAFSERRTHPASWFFVPFLVYAALNAAVVSPVPWLAWRDWLGWAQIAATLAIVLNGVRHPAPRFFLFGMVVAVGVIAVVLAGYQRFLWPDWLMLGRKQAAQFIGRASGPFGIPNSLAAFLLLLIPAMFAYLLQRGASAFQRVLAGYLALLFLFGLGLTISRGAWLSLLCAAIVWPLCLREKSWEWRMTASVAATTAAVLVALAVYVSVPRVKERFDTLIADMGERSRPILWRGSWQLFQDAPLLGTGAGSFNVLFERHRPVGFRDEPQWTHNDYLNTLSDYGIVGFVLAFGGMAAICRSGRGRGGAADPQRFTTAGFGERDITRGLGVGLFAFALSMTVDFHLKIPALGLVLALVLAEFVLRRWPPPETPERAAIRRQALGFAGASGVAMLLLALALPLYRSEAARYRGRQTIDQLGRALNPSLNAQRTALTVASQALTEATILDEKNAQAWADRAYAAALWARVAPNQTRSLGADAETAARQALAISDVVPEFWIRLGVALDLQGKWREGTDCFGRAIQLAPNSSTVWYYYAYHLSLIPASRALALSAVQMALRLDPGFRPAMILQESLTSTP